MTVLLIVVLVFLISALPLHFAVKILGGKTSFFKTAFVTLLTGVIAGAVKQVFRFWGWLLAFIIIIWIYHEAFRLKWFKAFLAWLMQFIFLGIFYFLAIILGITLIVASFI